jgi:hypothetical protein
VIQPWYSQMTILRVMSVWLTQEEQDCKIIKSHNLVNNLNNSIDKLEPFDVDQMAQIPTTGSQI